MRGAGQLRIEANVAGAAGRLWRRATIVQVAERMVRSHCRRVEVDYAVVKGAIATDGSPNSPASHGPVAGN